MIKNNVITINVLPGNHYKNGASAFVTFAYNFKYVELLRQQPERHWDAENKVWEVPYDNLNYLISRLNKDQYTINISKEVETLITDAVCTDTIPDNYVFKTTPFAHQIEGVQFGLKHPKHLNGDEQGLGKSKQTIDLACIKKELCGYKHCLVIACVNGLKYNWQEEVGTHSNETGYILGTRINKKGKTFIGSNEERLKDLENIDTINSYFIITNIETLRYSKKQQVPLKTKGPGGVTRYKNQTVFPIVEKLQELIKKGEISMVVADEIHKCKDSNSQQGRALLSLNAETMVGLTGTPLMNSPMDLYTPLKFIGVEKHSFYNFQQHYCVMGGFGGHQIITYRNIPELQTLLNTCMVRRLKDEVLDLPEKVYINDYVEMPKTQSKLYDEILDDLRQNIDKVKLSPNPLTMLIRLRQCTGNPSILTTQTITNPKYDRLLQLVEDVASNGKKCIVFSNWTDILNPAYELLLQKGYNPALYTGLNKDTREQDKQRFKVDPTCKVICGTIDAMGTGLTLTEATTVIFLDEPWNRAKKDQAEDRAHRIGTKEPVNIITLMCKDTIDEKIHKMVYRKGKMSDIIVDNAEDLFKNPEVINFLLS